MDIQLKPYKKDFEYSYSLGVFPTLELLEHKREHIIMILISSKGEKNHGVMKIIDICKGLGIEVQINDKAVNRISPKENCYAVGVFKKYDLELDFNKNHVVLVNPSDMGNLGTIIRTSIGFGIDNIGLIRPGVDIFDPKVVRASMGAVFKISFKYYDSFEDYMKAFNHQIFTFMLNAKMKLHDVSLDYKMPFTLVFGNEGSGLSDEFLEYGTSVIIPHTQNIDSLNLSIAVGIAEYEFTKGYFKN